MNDLVLLGKAFGDPTRVRIPAALHRSELCVCELADAMEMGLSTLSTHLQTFRQAGIIATHREGFRFTECKSFATSPPQLS